MAETPQGFDLAALLAPIAGEQPVGDDPRQDFSPQSPYLQLRDLRSQARSAERRIDNGDPDASDPTPLWANVRKLAAQALTERAKDLEIAAWYTEALLRSDGLPGLAGGCRLITGLVEAFWDTVYPLPDEDGVPTRVAPLAGLNGEGGGEGTLTQPLKKLTFYIRPDGAPFAMWQYEQSSKLLEIADPAVRQKRVDAGAVPFDVVQKEAAAIPKAHFAALRRAAADAVAAWQAMSDAVDARAGRDGPPTSAIRDLLSAILARAQQFAPPEEAAPQAAEPAAEEAGGEAGAAAGQVAAAGPGAPRGPLASREDALRALGDIAEFFRRNEPQSPTAYILDEAVRRARMTWPELLAEMAPDAAARAAILTSLGIKPAEG